MKKPPKIKLKYTHWRKDRNGVMQPYCVLHYTDFDGKARKFEAKMNEYTIEEVVRVRELLRQLLFAKQNLQKFGVETEASLITFGQVVDKWTEYKKRTVRSYTVKRYQSILDNHILPVFKDYPVQSINRQMIEDLIHKHKNRTAQYIHRILSNVFKFALKREYLEKSPFIEITFPTYQPRRIETLSKEEARNFLKLIKTSKHALLFEFALITGMRPEEYLALRWEDIDLQHGVAIVRHSINLQMPETVEYQDVKSKNSRRKIALSAKLITKLKKLKKSKSDPTSLNLVFAAANGKPLRLNNLTNRHFKPIIEKITKKAISLYCLRHTCATLLLLAGENPKVVAERLGNSVEVTLKTYSHVSPNMQKSASEKLQNMLI